MPTVKLFGVLLVFGATVSQVNPMGSVAAVAVNVRTVESVLVTATVCVDARAPAAKTMLMELVLTLSSSLLLTFSVTGMDQRGRG